MYPITRVHDYEFLSLFEIPWVSPFSRKGMAYYNVIIIALVMRAKYCGSRDVAVVRALASQQCGSASIPGHAIICGLSFLLVLVLSPRGFFSGYSGFAVSSKATFIIPIQSGECPHSLKRI